MVIFLRSRVVVVFFLLIKNYAKLRSCNEKLFFNHMITNVTINQLREPRTPRIENFEMTINVNVILINNKMSKSSGALFRNEKKQVPKILSVMEW